VASYNGHLVPLAVPPATAVVENLPRGSAQQVIETRELKVKDCCRWSTNRCRRKRRQTVDHSKCPDCGITVIDRFGFEAPCPRCLLRTGAVVQLEPCPPPEGADTAAADEVRPG
jgi:hypothetical protein